MHFTQENKDIIEIVQFNKIQKLQQFVKLKHLIYDYNNNLSFCCIECLEN